MKERKSEERPVRQIIHGSMYESETSPQRMVTMVKVAENVRKQNPMEVAARLREAIL